MLRLLNTLKEQESWRSHDSDYNCIFKFVHKLFEKDFEAKKEKRLKNIADSKAKYTLDEEKLIDSMYQEECGFYWNGEQYAKVVPIEIEVAPECQANIELAARGEITVDEMFARNYALAEKERQEEKERKKAERYAGRVEAIAALPNYATIKNSD